MGLNLRSHVMIYGPTVEYLDANFVDTNHARGYIIFPTARRDGVDYMSDEALDGFYHSCYYGECERGPFIKDSN